MDGQAVEDVSCRNVHGSASYLPSVWRPAVVTTCRRPGARAAACASPPPPKPNSPQHLLFFFSCSPHSSAHTLTAALRLRNPSNHALLGGDKGSTEGSVQHHTREPRAVPISQLCLFLWISTAALTDVDTMSLPSFPGGGSNPPPTMGSPEGGGAGDHLPHWLLSLCGSCTLVGELYI